MRADGLLHRLVDHLQLSDPTPLAGGEFGALLVRSRDGRRLVLKALPSPAFAERYARGARLAMRLRARGYPAPEYIGTGVAFESSWSLQEFLPGEIPETPSPAQIRTLLALAEQHAGAAGERADMRDRTLRHVRLSLKALEPHESTRTFADEIAAVMRATEDVELLDDGVVHGDFHHRNFLAIGDEVTGVFDWDWANVGDWRADVAHLAFWCALLPDMIPPDAGRLAVDRAHEICGPRVLAFFAASMAARQLDFDIREHPERLAAIGDGVGRAIAPWWRPVLR
jgi:thiamine kinase-like enzyme